VADNTQLFALTITADATVTHAEPPLEQQERDDQPEAEQASNPEEPK
jgi:hypothetical protein